MVILLDDGNLWHMHALREFIGTEYVIFNTNDIHNVTSPLSVMLSSLKIESAEKIILLICHNSKGIIDKQELSESIIQIVEVVHIMTGYETECILFTNDDLVLTDSIKVYTYEDNLLQAIQDKGVLDLIKSSTLTFISNTKESCKDFDTYKSSIKVEVESFDEAVKVMAI